MSEVKRIPAETGAPARRGSELDDLIGFLALSNRISTRLHDAASLNDAGISLADWLLLNSIKEDSDAASMSDVARKIGVSRQRIHQQANQLEGAGFIAIAKAADGKSRKLSLSPAGRTLLGKVQKNLRGALSEHGDVFATQMHNARRSAARVAKTLGAKAGDEKDKAA